METDKDKAKRPRILMSHPEEAWTRLLTINLGDAYDVIEANSGEETVALLDQPFSVIVITIIMPRIPGGEMIEEIRRRGISTPIIIVSAGFREEGEERLRQFTGVFGCMSQCNFRLERFKEMLDAAIATQSRKPHS